MMFPNADVQIAVIAGVLAFGLMGLLISLFFPLMNRYLAALPAKWQPRLLMLFGSIPFFTGLGLIGFCSVAGSGMDLLVHHCHSASLDSDCIPHAPVQELGFVWDLLLVLSICFVALVTVMTVRQIYSWRRLSHNLALFSRFDDRLGVYVVDDVRPLAVCAGMFRPKVYLSTGLLATLSPGDLKIVINHEKGHVQRRDGIKILALQMLTLSMPGRSRKLLLRAFRLAIERVCDEYAVKKAGDRIKVAETILKMERLQEKLRSGGWQNAFSILGSAVGIRVTSLLEEEKNMRFSGWLLLAVLTLLVATLAYVPAELVHHSIETALAQMQNFDPHL